MKAAKRILDSLFTFVGILDLDGTVLEVNRPPLTAAGLEASDVVGKKFWDTYWLSHSSAVQAELRAACARAAAGETVRRDVVVRMARDTRMTIDLQIAPLVDDDGRIVWLISSAVDITDRKRVEDQVRESEARFREMADHLPLLVWLHDEHGAQEMANDTFCRFFGVTREEMRGGRWQMLLHPDDAAAYTQSFLESHAARTSFRAEARVRRADGEWRWVESWAHPRHTPSGRFRGYIGATADITDRKAAERALLEADQRKDEYLAVLGHELRNPLAAIRSTAELLKALRSTDPRLERAADALDRQSAQMIRLVDGLLDASRIQRGKIDLHRERFDLRTSIETTIQDYRAEAEAKGVALIAEPARTPAWISADRVRLHQVLGNLVGNAIKFTPTGGQVEVAMHLAPSSVTLTVRDTGVGITPTMLEAIFEPFCQEPQAIARPSGGLGLGLAVVRSLVELHGGHVRATSRGRGHGAELVVELPTTSAPTPEAPAPRAHAQGRHILVVEDNTDAAQLLQAVLELRGHTVDLAPTGEDALRRLDHRPVDAVLCDLGLPGMSGYDVAKALRDRPDRPLLIALTGYGQADAKQEARDAGFDHHQTKPIDLDALDHLLTR